MKYYSIEYLPEAKQDIEAIFNYISTKLENKPAAVRITKAIIEKCESLKTFPNGYAVRFYSRGQAIRFVHYGKYTIAYYVDETATTVIIYAVKYSRTNLETALSEHSK